MSIWWSLHLRREAASVPLARRLLLGAMETAGVDPEVSYDLSVALSEACANAVEHGGAEAPGGSDAGEYLVTAYLDDDMCRIEVTDSGPGFRDGRSGGPRAAAGPRPGDSLPAGAPAAVAVDGTGHEAEHGRGLFLIEAFADHVDFRNRPGDGAVVSFDKALRRREDVLERVS